MRVELDLDRLPPDVKVHRLDLSEDGAEHCWILELVPTAPGYDDVVTIVADTLGVLTDLGAAIQRAVAEATP